MRLELLQQQLEEQYKIGIAGLGLLGGSLSLILKKKFGNKIDLVAFSREKTLEKAAKLNIFSQLYTYSQIKFFLYFSSQNNFHYLSRKYLYPNNY